MKPRSGLTVVVLALLLTSIPLAESARSPALAQFEWSSAPVGMSVAAAAQPSNFTQLVQAFDNLSAEYTTLNQKYSQLVSSYGQLSSNQQGLAASYANLTSAYSKVASDQASLAASFADQTRADAGVLSQYSTLSSGFNSLNSEYTALSQSYNGLLASYQQVSNQLSFYETFTYLLVAALVAIALVALWLFRKR